MVLAPVDPQREEDLRRLLGSMSAAPGRVDPNNPLIPFARFGALHFARLLILDDQTSDDLTVYGLPRRTYPRYLAFLGELDGDEAAFLEELTRCSQGGLRAVFSCCEGFTPSTDILRWMKQHSVPSAATYVNWRGRTMRQVREEAALHDALERYLKSNASALSGESPQGIHATLRRFVAAETAAGRLTLTPERPTPLGWRVRNLLHLVGVPLLLLLTAVPLAIIAAIVLARIRQLEKTDPENTRRVDPEHAAKLSAIEDYDVTNQFSAFGSLKPGLARRWTITFVLWLVNYTTQHIYICGRLARVRTIHFARWVFLDDKQRVLFTSNYDGSLESYNDDFINKAAFGLNVIFSNGIGYPRTNWLIFDGAKDEQRFKWMLRRHQLPTDVWYNAHPGLTAFDLERNARIRAGLESPSVTDEEAREWIALL